MNQSNQIIQSHNIETKRTAPANLITCAKLSRAEKMAIFEARQHKILRFLVEEGYSSLANLAHLLTVSKQTALRILEHLCYKGYLIQTKEYKSSSSLHPTLLFQPTPAGTLLCSNRIKTLSEPIDFNGLKCSIIVDTLKLQEVRLKLEKQGYRNFINSNSLASDFREYNNKGFRTPDYICINPQNERVAIEYERTIKTTKRYGEIIGQYLEFKNTGIVKTIQFVTDMGFADKLKMLFNNIDTIYRLDKPEKLNPRDLEFFSFAEVD